MWDVITHDEAISLIADIDDPKLAAERLVEEAIDRFTSDNITVIVVNLKQE